MTSQAKESLSISAFKAARTNVKRIAAELTEAGAIVTHAHMAVAGVDSLGFDVRGEVLDGAGNLHLRFAYHCAGWAIVFNESERTTRGFDASHEELLGAIRTWSGVRTAVAA